MKLYSMYNLILDDIFNILYSMLLNTHIHIYIYIYVFCIIFSNYNI